MVIEGGHIKSHGETLNINVLIIRPIQCLSQDFRHLVKTLLLLNNINFTRKQGATNTNRILKFITLYVNTFCYPLIDS